jgi:tetratricopeptide (TPR) repeat protein
MKTIFAVLFGLCTLMLLAASAEEGASGSDQATDVDKKHEMKQPAELSRETIIVEDKAKAAEHLEAGITLYKQKKYTEALDEFKLAKAMDLSDPRPNYYMGKIFTENGEPDKAMENFEASIKRDPNYIDSHLELAAIYMSASMWDDALEQYDEIIRIDPLRAEAHFSRGVVLSSMQKDQDAVKEFEEAIKLKPDYGRAYYNIGVILFRKGFKNEALSEFQKAVASEKKNYEAYKYMGLIYLDRYNGEIKTIQQLESSGASKVAIDAKRTDNQKNKDQALDSFNKSLEIFSAQPDVKRVVDLLEARQ